MKTLLRQFAGRVLARTMADLLLLLFAVSQLSAIVDFGKLAAEVQAAPFLTRAMVAGVLIGVGALTVGRMVREIRDPPAIRWVWSLPLPDATVGGGFLLLAWIRLLPVALMGLVLGLPGSLGVGLGAGLLGVAVACDKRAWVGLVVLAPLAAGAGPLVALGLLGVPALGRQLRRSRRLLGTSTRSIWWARGPVGARLNRDLLALWRHSPGTLALIPGVAAFGWVVQALLQDQWDAAGLRSGALLYGLIVGILPLVVLERQAQVLGRFWLPRQDAVSSTGAALALFGSAALPGLGLVFAQALAGVGGPVNALSLLAMHGLFASFAVWSMVRRSVPQRRHALGPTLFVVIFGGIGNFAIGLPAAVFSLFLCGLFFLSTVRSMR